MRARLPFLAAAAVTVALGLGVRSTMDGQVAKYGGDTLYTLLIFWLVLVVAPRIHGLVAGAIACGFSWAVEFFQLTPVPAELSGNPLARLVLGSTFNAPDLFWYVVGAAVGVAVLRVLRDTRRPTQDRTTVAADTCPPEGDMSTDDTAREKLLDGWQQWRDDRDAGFRKPYSALSLVAMQWLDEDGDAGETFDEVPGLWRVADGRVTVTATAADGLTLSGVPVDGETPIPLPNTTSGETLRVGDVVIEVIERGGFAFRVRDPKSPALAAFTGVPTYAPEARWILDAVYEPYETARTIEVGSVVERYTSTDTAAGVVRFHVDGEEQTLTVFPDGEGFWALFRDATSGVTTNASARFVDIEAPSADGRVLLDFNRASNLPCAFNDYSTCPVPPYENRLKVAIEAGEKIPV